MPGETYDAANLHRCSRPGRTAWSALQHRSDLGSPWQASPHPRRPRPLHVQPEHGPGNAPSKVPGRPACGRRQGWCPMTPALRRKPAVYDPGPVSLADAVDRQPEAPAVKPGRTLPASIEPMLGIDDLAAILSCSRQLVEREAIPEAAVVETNTKTRSTHDLCYTIMQQGKPHGRNR